MRKNAYGRLIWVPAIYLALTLGLALFVFLRNSVLTSGGMGRVLPDLTAGNFLRLLEDSYYAEILMKTVAVSAATVALCILLGVPLAIFLRHVPGRWANLLFVVILASSAMSLVVRALGWILILNDNGPLNRLLVWLGLATSPAGYLGSDAAIVFGLTHGLLPIFVLTLYPVTQSLDPALEQAAEGLGASRWQTLFRVLLPLVRPAILSASLLVFALCMGAYTTPALLAGGRAMLFPILIQQQTTVVMNYPVAASLAAVLTVIVLAITWAGIAAGARGARRGAGA